MGQWIKSLERGDSSISCGLRSAHNKIFKMPIASQHQVWFTSSNRTQELKPCPFLTAELKKSPFVSGGPAICINYTTRSVALNLHYTSPKEFVTVNSLIFQGRLHFFLPLWEVPRERDKNWMSWFFKKVYSRFHC